MSIINSGPGSTERLDSRNLEMGPSSTDTALAHLRGRALEANRGVPLNLDWVEDVRVNTSAVERRAQTLVTRRTVKKDWQAAWLLRAISCMDLTTLSGDDTDERVRRLCAKGRHPLQQELVAKLGIESLDIKVAAICVYHVFIETARRALEGSGIRVAAVSTGFPAGLSPVTERVNEIRRSVEAGADEIDVVITRAHVFGAKWQALYDEISSFKHACGPAHMKVILGTGDLLTLRNVARASVVAMMAGADFIKTSTGKEPVNATLPVGLVMTRAIREYANQTGFAVGFKPAGGIRTAKQSMEWLSLMKEELGPSWLKSDLFRFGASGMLADIERQLDHHATGRYSADYRHPIS
ncbi:MAG TPA: deoxyribose-phosphate aldolase [Candidatus Solibacter sp.]|nr:deoxyribose-phosphate aldolase [Candidatus Solibacter sp.]